MTHWYIKVLLNEIFHVYKPLQINSLYARGKMYEVGNDSILQLNYFIMNLQYNNAARELFLFNYMY